MAVRCRNCKNLLQDPGGPLAGRHCGICGSRDLERTGPDPPPASSIAGAAAGGLLGGALFGPGGALIGGVLGFIVSATASAEKSGPR